MLTFCSIISSTRLAHWILWGWGIPWVMIVDSKATTGSLFCKACLTLSEIIIDWEDVENNLRQQNLKIFGDIIIFVDKTQNNKDKKGERSRSFLMDENFWKLVYHLIWNVLQIGVFEIDI